MSVKQGLMALLAEGPMYGAQLRAEFEQRTGGTWPLNVGQVYTTLARLERDGLVEATGEADAEGHHRLHVTARPGREDVDLHDRRTRPTWCQKRSRTWWRPVSSGAGPLLFP